MSTSIPASEADILRRAIDPAEADLSVATLSTVDFATEDHTRMEELAAKAREGTLTEEERLVLDRYEVVNDLLGILRSKARRSLKQSRENPA